MKTIHLEMMGHAAEMMGHVAEMMGHVAEIMGHVAEMMGHVAEMFMYVGQDGRIVEDHKPSTGHWIEIVGSPQASHQAMYTAIAAYNHAKDNNLWNVHSYAMVNYREYFAEATGAFFLVNKERSTIGGMIK
nr:hypothetical protein BaRGS_033506 [Batillaria attramentaria]